MQGQPATLDHLARRLVQAAEKDLLLFLGTTRLDSDLVAELYLRVRELIDRSEPASAADDLALAMYLTASAWQPSASSPVDLLASLHAVIGRTLAIELSEAPARAGVPLT